MKNLMKKSLVSVVVVLVASSLASAGAAGWLVGGSATANITPGGTVSVELSGVDVSAMTLMNIIDTASIGGVASNASKDYGWTLLGFTKVGNLVNSGGVLITDATGAVDLVGMVDGVPKPPLQGTIYSFDYTADLGLPIGEVFTIATGAGTNKVSYINPDATTGSVLPAALSLTVVPEPMTIALLGLGGLFLRRKK